MPEKCQSILIIIIFNFLGISHEFGVTTWAVCKLLIIKTGADHGSWLR